MVAGFLPSSSASELSLLGLGTFEPEKLRGKALYRKRATEENFLCKKPQGKPLMASNGVGNPRGSEQRKEGV